MNDYKEVRLDFRCAGSGTGSPELETATDVMAALLCDAGYESFEPDDKGLTAYIKAADYDGQSLAALVDGFPLEGFIIEWKEKTVEGQDWNSEWEKHYFKPIVVGDRCVIHSSFHTDYPACEHEIVIDPKMAFGTGHHATTSLIIEQLLARPMAGKSVIDMGTGTGILAILAAMLGAAAVTAIEIDPAAEVNARENVVSNGHPEINVMLGDAALLDGLHADVFIANINRNIITADLPAYASTMSTGGLMLLSGFYESDIPVVMEAAAPLGLAEASHTVKGDGWTCLALIKE